MVSCGWNFDQGHVSLYLNGVLVAEDFGLSTMVDSEHDVFLGGSSHPVSGAYHRDIDDVRIHNCALSEEEVLGLYNIDAMVMVFQCRRIVMIVIRVCSLLFQEQRKNLCC